MSDLNPPPGGAPALPDLNAETHPHALVKDLLSRAVYLNVSAVPSESCSELTHAETGQVMGIQAVSTLHPLTIETGKPGQNQIKASHHTGPACGSFNLRWMMAPDDYKAQPDQDPPVTGLDLQRSQSFAMLKEKVMFNGQDGIEGFGAGRTQPMEGGKLRASAVGNITRGFGKLENKEGLYVLTGVLDPKNGFTGSLFCRILDHDQTLKTQGAHASVRPVPDAIAGSSFLLFGFEKRDPSVRSSYRFGPNGMPIGTAVETVVKPVKLTCSLHEGIQSKCDCSQVIGTLNSQVTFNFMELATGGGPLSPITYEAVNHLSLKEGDQEIGSFTANFEGKTFKTALPDAPEQQAIRIGGFGPIASGTGLFQGARGMVLDISAVSIAPFETDGLFLVCLDDPDQKYRKIQE